MNNKIKKVYKHKINIPREVKIINTTINKFKTFYEIIHFTDPFEVIYGKPNYELVDTETGEVVNNRKRKFIKDVDGKIIPRVDGTGINELEDSLIRSDRRARDKFYGYGLCNKWKYFCTFTIAVNQYKSTDDATKKYWKMFRENLQYRNPDVKILAVPEAHKKGNLHFHALLGNCNLENTLSIAINQKTGKPFKDIFNLSLWNKGYSTVKKIPDNDTDQTKVVQYLIKYLTKNKTPRYNQKKYYRTNNLDFKEKQMTYTSRHALLKNVDPDDILLKKENDTRLVYRIKYKGNPKQIEMRYDDET